MKLLHSILGLLAAGQCLASTVLAAEAPAQLDGPAAIKLYGSVGGRTVLQPTDLKLDPLPYSDALTNVSDGPALLEKHFAQNGVAVIPDGKKFVILAPKAKAGDVPPASEKVPFNRRDTTVGILHFSPPVPVSKATDLFASLIGKTLDEKCVLPKLEIVCDSQTALTLPEMAYALETIFKLNGYAVVRDEKTFNLVPANPAAVPATGNKAGQ